MTKPKTQTPQIIVLDDDEDANPGYGVSVGESEAVVSEHGSDAASQQYFEVEERKQQTGSKETDFGELFNLMKKKGEERRLKNQRAYLENIKRLSSEGPPKPTKLSPKHISRQKDQKREQILKHIEPHIKNFKAHHNPNRTDTELARLQANLKEKTFTYLMYGIEELKHLNIDELSEQQQRLIKLQGKDVYALVRNLTVQIDLKLIIILNEGNRQIASKIYRNFVKSLIFHIAQKHNLDLRRKVLTRELSATQLANLKEQDLYSPHIREEMIRKQNNLLLSATVVPKNVEPVEGEYCETALYEQQKSLQQQKEEDKDKSEDKQDSKLIENQIPPTSPHHQPQYDIQPSIISKETIITLRKFLEPLQISKMKKHILTNFPTPGPIQQKLLQNLTQIFNLH